MREAVIVSTARTPIGKAFRGSLNDTGAPTMAAHVICAAITRARVEGREVSDVIMGCAVTQGTSSINVARHAVIAAGLPDSVAAMTLDRQCASGLSAIAAAAQGIRAGDLDIAIAGGVESISLSQDNHMNLHRYRDASVEQRLPRYYISMIETAELVAERYRIDRERQDRFALQSQERTAAAQAAGRFDEEIVPISTRAVTVDRQSNIATHYDVSLAHDECNRPDSKLDRLASLAPALADGRSITAGNASQLSDGASAVLMMSEQEAARRNLTPLGVLRGIAAVGVAPEEMGIGPVVAIPRLLARHGLTVDDVDLWEINEAFAAQVLACTDRLGIDSERLNVDGGAIALGHPYGMSGARMVGHALLEGRRRRSRYAVVSMCVGGGQGVAGLLELCH